MCTSIHIYDTTILYAIYEIPYQTVPGLNAAYLGPPLGQHHPNRHRHRFRSMAHRRRHPRLHSE